MQCWNQRILNDHYRQELPFGCSLCSLTIHVHNESNCLHCKLVRTDRDPYMLSLENTIPLLNKAAQNGPRGPGGFFFLPEGDSSGGGTPRCSSTNDTRFNH
jgi:hypothetical protein